MLNRDEKSGAAIDDVKLAKTFASQLAAVNHLVEHRGNADILPISYADAVKSPQEIANSVADFIGGNLKVEKMVSTVDPDLYRTKS